MAEPHYRVTALTLHPSDSLGSLIANLITNTARLPFESLYLRSLATAYVAAGEQPGSRSWLGQNIFPLSATFGSGFGPPGMKGRMDYASRIAMCLFAEAVIGVQVWWVGCAAAVWAGQRWYKWGRL